MYHICQVNNYYAIKTDTFQEVPTSPKGYYLMLFDESICVITILIIAVISSCGKEFRLIMTPKTSLTSNNTRHSPQYNCAITRSTSNICSNIMKYILGGKYSSNVLDGVKLGVINIS